MSLVKEIRTQRDPYAKRSVRKEIRTQRDPYAKRSVRKERDPYAKKEIRAQRNGVRTGLRCNQELGLKKKLEGVSGRRRL
jgi:hypothetical protein